MHASWQPFLQSEFAKPYFKELSAFLREAYATKQTFPKKSQVFKAFETDLNDVKVVILGQDPYHTPGAAMGLAFSVPETAAVPPSLVNIYKEIDSDFDALRQELQQMNPNLELNPDDFHHHNPSGDLTPWQKQGVLLLNNTLTVEAGLAGSHRGRGWENFTKAVIEYLNETRPHLVFILWGRDARSKAVLIDQSKHLVLESAHPSPLSAYHGFFGSRPFSKTNAFLNHHHLKQIIW